MQTALGGTPPILLNYLGTADDLRLGGVRLTAQPSPSRTARTDLAITCWDGDHSLVSEVEYSSVSYDEHTVLILLRDLDSVLAAGSLDARLEVGSLRTATRSAARRPEPGSVAGERPSESAVADLVSQAWADLLGYPPEHPDEDFFACGGHSLSAVLLIGAIAERAETGLDLAAWLAEPTPRAILDQLLGTDSDPARPPSGTLVTMREGTGRHLHLLAGAGGTAHDYGDLVAALPKDWRVTFSQEREPLDSVTAMAARYRADLDAAGLRPDTVCGWSIGGMIAQELARAYGETAHLVLIDSPPPIGFAVDADAMRQFLHDFVATVCLSLGVEVDGSMPRVAADDVPLTLRALAARLRVGGHDVSGAVLLDRWQVYHRQLLASSGHLGRTSRHATTSLIAADLTDADLAEWSGRLEPSLRIVRIDTDHFGVLRPPHIAEVAAVITSAESVPV